MKTEDLKTIDIQAKEWFDKVNGNSYFAANVTLNFGMSDEEGFILPFQYGYGQMYEQMTVQKLKQMGLMAEMDHFFDLRERGIIIRSNKQENCKQRELKNI